MPRPPPPRPTPPLRKQRAPAEVTTRRACPLRLPHSFLPRSGCLESLSHPLAFCPYGDALRSSGASRTPCPVAHFLLRFFFFLYFFFLFFFALDPPLTATFPALRNFPQCPLPRRHPESPRPGLWTAPRQTTVELPSRQGKAHGWRVWRGGAVVVGARRRGRAGLLDELGEVARRRRQAAPWTTGVKTEQWNEGGRPEGGLRSCHRRRRSSRRRRTR